MNALLISLALLLSSQNLPTYGDIGDLRGLSKVYVTADSTDARNSIIKELKKSPLSVVGSESDAEFFIETKEIAAERPRMAGIIRVPATAEMTVYTLVDGKKRIAWSKTKSTIQAARDLTKAFIKALKHQPH